MSISQTTLGRKSMDGALPPAWPYTASMALVSALVATTFAIGAYVNAGENIPIAAFLSAVTLAYATTPPYTLHLSLRTTYVQGPKRPKAAETSTAPEGGTSPRTE